MHLRRLIALSGALWFLAAPASLIAQMAGGVEFYGALDNSAPITRTLGGLSVSVGTPYVGIGGSGGLGISSLTAPTGTTAGPSDLGWAAHADLKPGPGKARLGKG